MIPCLRTASENPGVRTARFAWIYAGTGLYGGSGGVDIPVAGVDGDTESKRPV